MKHIIALLLVSSLAFAEPPADVPLHPHVVLMPDGGATLDRDAVQASERDRNAWKAQLAEAQVQKAAVLATVGTIGLVVGVVVGVFVVTPLVKPAK